METFTECDKDDTILTRYWVYLQEVSLAFDATWSPGSEVLIEEGDGGELYGICNCPRSLVWAPSTPKRINQVDIGVMYDGHDGGGRRTGIIAEVDDVWSLAVEQAEYQNGTAHLQIKSGFGFGTSTVKFVVRKMGVYNRSDYSMMHLSVIVEFIDRDDYNRLIEFQQSPIDIKVADDLPFAWRGNEPVVHQMSSPYENDQADVINDIRHVALEAMPLVLKRHHGEYKAVEQGLSYSDFLWELPHHHERRIVRPQASSSERDTCLRGLRLDICIDTYFSSSDQAVSLYIEPVELNLTSLPSKPPSCPGEFSFINNLHIDVPYSEPEDAAIQNSTYHGQTFGVSANGSANVAGANATPRGMCIATNGSVVTLNVNGPLQIMGPMMGDIFSGPISGGNVGGRSNINHSTTPPTMETIVSAVLSAMRSTPSSNDHSDAQTRNRGTKRRSDKAALDEMDEDMEQPNKRRQPTSFLSRFWATLFGIWDSSDS